MKKRFAASFIIAGAILITGLSFSVYASEPTTRRDAGDITPAAASERGGIQNKPSVNPLHRRAEALGIDTSGLTDEEIQSQIDEAWQKAETVNPSHRRAEALGINIDGFSDEEIQSKIDETRQKAETVNPLHRRAEALGIDIDGLTDDEIQSQINELRPKAETVNPLHRRAAALGIDIVGLSDNEILERINEIRPNNNDVIVSINSRLVDFDQQPIIENGRTLVPMRAIFEALGLSVHWNPEKQEIIAYGEDGVYIEMAINSNIMIVGDTEIELDVAPIIINGRTLVPLRAISDAIGSEVEWDDIAKSASVQINPEAIYKRAVALGIDAVGVYVNLKRGQKNQSL